MGQTFFWHDYETFGANARRDRPAQFAGVRTDENLNVVEDPVMFYCRPGIDYVPDPAACLLTGITPQVCQERGLPEHQFAAEIERHLGAPRTIGTGYNTIKFDDEVTRFMLWRNLADPYAREWQNACGRWDIINMVRTAYALRPVGIEWPIKPDGSASFRLEDLARANKLEHDSAHDALSDVYATISLAKLIKDRQPELFSFCLSLNRKRAVEAQIRLGTQKPFVYITGLDGGIHGGIMIAIPLCVHPSNGNDVIVWDLSKDPRELLELEAAEIRLRMFTRKDEMPEGMHRMPVATISTNKSPVVISQLQTLKPDVLSRWNIDLDEAFTNLDRLKEVRVQRNLGELFDEVYKREYERADPEEDLYGGFVGDADRRILSQLRTLPGEKLAQSNVYFNDSRLHTLLFRYRARNFPETMTVEEWNIWQSHVRSKIDLGEGAHRTIAQARDEISTLMQAADERGIRILSELTAHLDTLACQAGTDQDVAEVDHQPTLF